MTQPTLRPATDGDVEAIAAIWRAGWPDGHLRHVPEELANHRRLFADFVRLVQPRVATTTVAVDGGVIGFVTVHDDEVEQVYVARSARGSGVAAALLSNAEETIAERFDRAWLAVVAGNARARRFYAREGWRDAGPFALRRGRGWQVCRPVPPLREGARELLAVSVSRCAAST